MAAGPLSIAPGTLQASPLVVGEWGARVRAEYASGAAVQHLTLWLLRLESPHQLVEQCLGIVADELEHARVAYAVFSAAGGSGLPAHDASRLGLHRDESQPLVGEALLASVQLLCLGETLAVPLFRSLQAGCSVPVARRALDRIVDDEVRHRDVGWSLLDWFLERDRERATVLVERALGPMFTVLEDAYGAVDDPATTIDPEDRAWGLAAPNDYAQILVGTYQRELLPRFMERGIDPRPGWAARLGPKPYLI